MAERLKLMFTIGPYPEVYGIDIQYNTSHLFKFPFNISRQSIPVISRCHLFFRFRPTICMNFLCLPFVLQNTLLLPNLSVFLRGNFNRQTQLCRPNTLVPYSVLIHVSTVYISHQDQCIKSALLCLSVDISP
jgi:hypothetical protein